MNRVRLSAKALALIGGVGVAAATLAGSAFAAVQPSDGDTSPATIVIRGSTVTAEQSPAGNDPPPVVLRGSPSTPVQPPSLGYACPSGYGYDPTYGCGQPAYAYAPDDYGYWPYGGWDGFFGGRSHRFGRGFAHGVRRGLTARFGHRAPIGFGHGFVHAGGFGRR